MSVSHRSIGSSLMQWLRPSISAGLATLVVAALFTSSGQVAQARLADSQPRGLTILDEEPNDPDYVPEAPDNIPKVLIRKDLSVMTPTLWCKNHRRVCVDELVKQYSAKFRNGEMNRTQWATSSSNKIQPVHKGAFRALCEGEGATTAANDPTQCPSIEGTTMTADQAWSRFRSDAHCAYEWVPWAGQPQYRLMCKPLAPGDGFSDAEKSFVKCEALVLFTSGATLRHGGPGPGAFAFGVGTGVCSLSFIFDHFLDW